MQDLVINLHIGGMIAAGFSASGRYFLAVSHGGRGLYDSTTWKKVAPDSTPDYPIGGVATGIGPIEGEAIAVVERGNAARLICSDQNGNWRVTYEDGVAVVTKGR
ncbi:MAG: hypothetical protein HOO99_17190 [Hyphomicrobiaceae bacterium]|nr:hypothetical protein [Hyphomicrobiaceae bacterium]